jgi:DNA-binding CsgD family transcriptional regulator
VSGKAAGADAGVVAPPPFGIVRIRRAGPPGRLEPTFMDESIATIIGASVDDFLASPAGRALLAEARELFARADDGRSHADAELFLGAGARPAQRLHARLHMRVAADGEATVVAVVHDLTGGPEVRPLRRQHPHRQGNGMTSAIVRVERDAGGGLHLRLDDEAIAEVVGGGLHALPGSPVGRAILDRAAALLALDEWSADLPLNDLALPPVDGSRRVLHARFIRGASPDGEPAVDCVVSDMSPVILGEIESARRSGALLRLLRLSEILLERLPVEAGLERMVEEIAAAPGFRSVAIAFLDDGEGRLAVRAHRGIPGRPPGLPYVHAVADGPCRLAVEERRTVVSRRPDAATTCVYVPIVAEDKVLGILDICAETGLPWGAWDEEIVGTMADYVAALVTGAPVHPRALTSPTLRRGDAIDIPGRLTRRQRQVLFFLVDAGASNREIAERLDVTEATVKVHMRAIMRRLEVASRTEAVHLVFSRAAGWLAETRARHGGAALPDRSAA